MLIYRLAQPRLLESADEWIQHGRNIPTLSRAIIQQHQQASNVAVKQAHLKVQQQAYP